MKRVILRNFFKITCLLGVYQLIYFLLPVKNFLPSIVELGRSAIDNFSNSIIYSHILSSLQRVLIGFSLAAIAGIVIGIAIGYSAKLRWLKSYIEILRPIPPIAWIPMAILVFGLGDTASYFIVFMGAFFPIFSSTYFGVLSLPRIYKNVAMSFELSRLIYIEKIIFAYSLPYIFSGLKIGIGMAWMAVIAAELISTNRGLGYYIQINRLLLRTDNVLIGMMLIGIVGYLLNKLIEYFERICIKWRR